MSKKKCGTPEKFGKSQDAKRVRNPQSENSHDAKATLVPAVYVNRAKQIHTVYYLILKEDNREIRMKVANGKVEPGMKIIVHCQYYNRQKLNVRLAAQTISFDVAHSIKQLNREQVGFQGEATCEFIRVGAKLFQIMNAKRGHSKSQFVTLQRMKFSISLHM